MRHTPPASTPKAPAGASPDVDPGALVARVFVQEAASRFTWSETEQPLDRPRPFMYGDRGYRRIRLSATRSARSNLVEEGGVIEVDRLVHQIGSFEIKYAGAPDRHWPSGSWYADPLALMSPSHNDIGKYRIISVV